MIASLRQASDHASEAKAQLEKSTGRVGVAETNTINRALAHALLAIHYDLMSLVTKR